MLIWALGISLMKDYTNFSYSILKIHPSIRNILLNFYSIVTSNEWYFTKDEYDGLIRKFRNLLP